MVAVGQVDNPNTPLDVVIDIVLELFAGSGGSDKDNREHLISIIRKWSIFRVRWWKSKLLPKLFEPLQDFRNYSLEGQSPQQKPVLKFRSPAIQRTPLQNNHASTSSAQQGNGVENALNNARQQFILFLLERQFIAPLMYGSYSCECFLCIKVADVESVSGTLLKCARSMPQRQRRWPLLIIDIYVRVCIQGF